jgi:hypothetical protein
MSQFEIYRAQRGAEASEEVGAAAGVVTTPFTIEVRFLGGLTQTQRDAFKTAANRWSRVIVGDLPNIMIDGKIIDDVVISAQGTDIDGAGGILGQAGPTHLRPAGAGQFAFIPARGVMSFDTADLAEMESEGTLGDVITHEMGHVIGVGTIWSLKGLLQGAGTNNPTFHGARAMEEFGRLRNGAPAPVPVENTGGQGTRDSHWRESVFRNELMSGFIGAPGNPISRLTVGGLADCGYVVDLNAAEPYSLPNNLLELATGGHLMPHTAPINAGFVLPSIPLVMPEGGTP